MNNDTVLEINNVSKKFCKNLKTSMVYAGKDLLSDFCGIKKSKKNLRKNEFWALKDINLTLKKGDSLALLGANGSGKTTLLKLISGLIPPDSGTISINGRVASLIAVGAGFHPHLTGRENIFLNGAILGLSKTFIEKNFDWIVDFSEIEDFLEAPVSTYSSGMRVRLGFAIASCCEPDLLLLDEILAVGDSKFRQKCYHRISKIIQNCAVVFVSHNMTHVSQVCTRGLLLNKGNVVTFGNTNSVIDQYYHQNTLDKDIGYVKLLEPVISYELSFSSLKIDYGEELGISLALKLSRELITPQLRLQFIDVNHQVVGEWNSERKKNDVLSVGPSYLNANFNIKDIRLKSGQYYISIIINENKIGVPFWYYKREVLSIGGSEKGSSSYQLI